MSDEESFAYLGEATTAAGNWWVASVRREIGITLQILEVDMSNDILDELARNVAIELDYRWHIHPKGAVPKEFEPVPDSDS